MTRLSQLLLLVTSIITAAATAIKAQPAKPTRIEISFDDASVNAMLELSRLSTLPDQPPIPVQNAWDFGIDLAYLKDLRHKFENEWKADALEGILNQFEHYTVPVGDNADTFSLHYIHAKSNRTDAIPLLLLHGWPGSVYDYHKVIPALVDPPEGKPAFHVVAPSLPGYFLSKYPQRTGWTVLDTARVFNQLMVDVLGYPKYAVQGGDWGQTITRVLGSSYSDTASFVHINLAVPPPDFDPATANLTDLEKLGLERFNDFNTVGNGYYIIQETKPFTVGYSVGASPLSILAYIGEKFIAWSDPAVPHEWDIIHTTALYYLSGAFTSSVLIYHENNATGPSSNILEWKAKSKFGYTHYKYESAVCPVVALGEYADNVTYHAEYDKGGHFPTLDVPELYAEDVQKCFLNF